ncbi:MAG: NAD(P)-dependent alcohol dehydrogenase [Planctomycetes bacterium]|nr:NAD(P)-dependent alcohol dehydrogenase [Planctomycetota bacterium]
MNATKAYAAASASSPLQPTTIRRREPTDRDVELDILFCGICHSDLHAVRDEWKSLIPTVYPIVPGHEIVGRVRRVGGAVTKYRVGELAAVGCLVGSDRTCPMCRADHENLCAAQVWTFNGPDEHLGGVTYGGYSQRVVVDEHFVLKVPESLDPAGAAPLLCAGITSWSPLRRHGVAPGKRVGIVGLGGLGHMGVKFARALGAHTVAFTTSPTKAEDALRLGADEVVISRDRAAMQARAGTLDFVLDTVSAAHDVGAYLDLLAPEGNLTLVGAPEQPISVPAFSLLMGCRNLSGSAIGGLAETQEMLDFCGEHGITADVEVIAIQQVNEAYERLLRSDVKYRFCIDMASLEQE